MRIRKQLLFAAVLILPVALLISVNIPAASLDTDGLPKLALGGSRGPSALLFTDSGKTLYVTEQDTGSISVIDPENGKLIQRIPSGGKEPVSITLAANLQTLVVTNNLSDSLGIIDSNKRTLKASFPLPGGPWGVVTTGSVAYVALSRLDQVAAVDIKSGKVIARIPVGRRPRCLAITPDGAWLVCANMTSGDLSVLDVKQSKEVARIPLGAINLRGLAISADGATACVTGMRPHNDVPTVNPEAMWSNVLLRVALKGAESRVVSTASLDSAGKGAADPNGVVVSGGTIWVAIGGAHELAAVNATEGMTTSRTQVGANPRAIAARPNGEIWAANFLGNSLTVCGASGKVLRTIELEAPTLADIRLRGKFFFTSAHITKGGRFSCNSCHPDGSTDGLVWQFAHVKDGIDRRNSRNLRGPLLLTGGYGWTAREEDFEDFVNTEIRQLIGGPKMSHSVLHAFWDLVNDQDMPPNPYRQADGTFTAAAVRGKALFTGLAGCGSCHEGDRLGGTGKRERVGTTSGVDLDIPHLTGLYDTAPYLHDGRAADLEEIFTKCNTEQKHGKAHMLNSDQLKDLVEYLREL